MNKIVFTLLAVVFTSSCALGTSELKVDYPDKQNLIAEQQSDSTMTKDLAKDISVTAKWIGNGYPIATAKGITGLNNRFVIPYTRLTSLVNLKIVNNSDKFIDFNNNELSLNIAENKFKPLDIEFFKNRWPSYSVKTQEMLIDRSVAMGEVIRTILRDEKIAPKTTHQGYVAFLKIPDNAKEVNLVTSVKIDNEIKNIDFRFTRK